MDQNLNWYESNRKLLDRFGYIPYLKIKSNNSFRFTPIENETSFFIIKNSKTRTETSANKLFELNLLK